MDEYNQSVHCFVNGILHLINSPKKSTLFMGLNGGLFLRLVMVHTSLRVVSWGNQTQTERQLLVCLSGSKSIETASDNIPLIKIKILGKKMNRHCTFNATNLKAVS